jgi:hypothetical protein
MADEQPEEEGLDFSKRFAEIVKREKPKTHHECECRECSPLTAMGERGEAFSMARSLLRREEWAEDDQPSVRETMLLADWLLYGPSDGD